MSSRGRTPKRGGATVGNEAFLVPADAPRPEVGPRFKLAALSLRRFGEFVRLAEAKHALAVFDSCFAGTSQPFRSSRHARERSGVD